MTEGNGSATQRERRVVVGVSGGSGMAYAFDLLRTLHQLQVRTDLIVTSGAKRVLPSESDRTLHDLTHLASEVHDDRDLGASIASGSVPVDGMAIVPCSAGTLAKVAQGATDNLVSRAAHVTMKERRPLLLLVREAPYSRPMLRNMLDAFDAGAVIVPASPGFYHRPATIDDLIGSVTARLLDHLEIPNNRSPRWREQGSQG